MLKQQIQLDSKEALKKGDEFSLGVLRMLLASISAKEKEKRYKILKEEPEIKEQNLIKSSELSEGEIIDAISSEVKKRKDAIVLYEKGNRQELADKEKKEIEVLQKYLPEQLSLEEIKKFVEESITKTEAKEIKDMGKVMSDLNPKIKGRADGGKVSQIVKSILAKK